ncbi:hypothetical protein D917_01862 [Trichinella nativa]|uniref:Uncharacterized protein n=1 Tax=Trichinella nativa TaxID=6335 RepID=A0A1Y3EKD3_9BILA|nr:hypothetical protein D917_01862 [Trichinella nativa]
MVIVDYQPSARATRYYSMLKLAADTHAGKMIWREHVNQIGQLGFRFERAENGAFISDHI